MTPLRFCVASDGWAGLYRGRVGGGQSFGGSLGDQRPQNVEIQAGITHYPVSDSEHMIGEVAGEYSGQMDPAAGRRIGPCDAAAEAAGKGFECECGRLVAALYK